MTTAAPSAPPARRAHLVEVPGPLRDRRRRVAAWALGRGTPLHRDALAAVIGARAASAAAALDPGDGTEVWTGPDVGGLLWTGIAEWCATNGAQLPPPDSVRETLVAYLGFLARHRLLAPGADTPAALRRAVAEYGGGPVRSASHPSMRRAPAPVVPLGPS